MIVWDESIIFTPVFHRILDFKNGAGFLSKPHFFNVAVWQCGSAAIIPVPLTVVYRC